MSICIINPRSSIARAFVELLPEGERVVSDSDGGRHHHRYLICAGYLAGKRLGAMPEAEKRRSWIDNFADIAALCDSILEFNRTARICIIGSESGYAGSFDMAYAGAKAALHLYIETKRLSAPRQQLVGIAPTIIADSGMTQRRPDLDAVEARGKARRIGRWLSAAEVAAAAHFLLYVDRGYTTGAILRMHGGKE